MGKNQHVVPANGKWGVKGEGNSKLTAVTRTQAEPKLLHAKFPRIKVQNCLFIARMIQFETETLTVRIHSRREVNLRHQRHECAADVYFLQDIFILISIFSNRTIAGTGNIYAF